MLKVSLILVLCLTTLLSCNSQVRENVKIKNAKVMDTTQTIVKTDEEWRKILTPEQYEVLREKGTDRPFTGKYYLTTDKGVYLCAACGTELFTSDMKFESSCGWPSFDKAMEGGKIKTIVDRTHGMVRTEIICAKCGGHLGHVFEGEGYKTPTDQRYCINGGGLIYVPAKGEPGGK